MSRAFNIAMEEIDQLETMADIMKKKARGLRKKLLHLYAGASPKGSKIDSADKLSVVTGLRRTIQKKVS